MTYYLYIYLYHVQVIVGFQYFITLPLLVINLITYIITYICQSSRFLPGDKPYYYNAKTREAAWSKPENMKVIKQEEFEAIAASGQDPIIVVTCMSLKTVFC